MTVDKRLSRLEAVVQAKAQADPMIDITGIVHDAIEKVYGTRPQATSPIVFSATALAEFDSRLHLIYGGGA